MFSRLQLRKVAYGMFDIGVKGEVRYPHGYRTKRFASCGFDTHDAGLPHRTHRHRTFR